MSTERKIYSVAEVNRKARMVLESGIGELWVEGELSGVRFPQSGHWYFDLKDERAIVHCVMYARDNQAVSFKPDNGLKIQIHASPSLYEARGDYQLKVREMEEAGKGNLQEQFEKLKAKLAEEGLFNEDRKKALPMFPRKIGVVTSPTGQAIEDILKVIKLRLENLDVLLAPAKVQGKGGATSIARAIDYLNTRQDIDAIIVGRGGGSAEDLWCFNEEIVARAIVKSHIPIISAVGHQTDFLISDFVADRREATPTAAAEFFAQQKRDASQDLVCFDQRLNQSLKTLTQNFRLRLNRAAQSYVFREPENLLRRYRRQIQGLETQMGSLLRFGVQQAQQHVDELGMVMHHRMERKVGIDRQSLVRLQSQLRMLNPLAVLGRGYSLTRRPDGTVVRSSVDVDVGDKITTQLADGKVVSKVTEKE